MLRRIPLNTGRDRTLARLVPRCPHRLAPCQGRAGRNKDDKPPGRTLTGQRLKAGKEGHPEPLRPCDGVACTR